MSYDNARKDFNREHLYVCDIIVGGQTYRFCEDIAPIPVGLEVEAATMSRPRIRPAQIDLTGGIGIRASVNLTFKSHIDSHRLGTLANPVRFWPKWRAIHPGYEGAEIVIYSGYIVNGAFDINNFQRMDFVVETFSYTQGGASIGGKDVLKLANNDRAKAPRKSKGSLQNDIDAVQTNAVLIPSGIGNLEYPTSGKVRIGDEVASFTRSNDILTLTRAVNNTVADEHSEGDLVQLCLEYNGTISDIAYDLLVNYSNVPAARIIKAEWDNEASLEFPNNLQAIITKETGVRELIKELGELGAYFYFDIYTNTIKMIAIKAPPDTAPLLTAESNLLEDKTNIKDETDMRVSTVIVNFGLFDPTKDLDEVSNYRQAHVRLNPNAVAKYNGIERYKVINSRWISNDNRVMALRLAAKVGRRFEDTPRMISFALDPKDSRNSDGSGIATGATAFINSDLILDSSGDRVNIPFQIISATEGQAWQYSALEYIYGDELPDDLGADDPNNRPVILSGNLDQLKDDDGNPRTLRQFYDDVWPDLQPEYNVYFILDDSCVAGSTDNTQYAIETGTFAGLTLEPLLDVRGLLIGKGGNGASVNGTPENGGNGLLLNQNFRLSNTGIIGGGGGGGHFDDNQGTTQASAGGGGGAGFTNGTAGGGTFAEIPFVVQQAQAGTNLTGGAGGNAISNPDEPVTASGGDGGDLGQNGTGGLTLANSGGTAGHAINTNGFTLTYVEAGQGDVRGAIL